MATHSGKRYWNCPICEARVNEPYVDMWIVQMLKDNQLGAEVVVSQDGTYEWVKKEMQPEI